MSPGAVVMMPGGVKRKAEMPESGYYGDEVPERT